MQGGLFSAKLMQHCPVQAEVLMHSEDGRFQQCMRQ